MTATDGAEVTKTHHLLPGDEQDVFGDADCQNANKRRETLEADTGRHNAKQRVQRRALTGYSLDQIREATEQAKVRIRARGKHVFHVIKNLFRYQ